VQLHLATIAELQHEFLGKLILCNKKMAVKQALYRLRVLNEHEAKRRIANEKV